MTARRPQTGSDDGQIMVLALGLTTVVLLLVTVIATLTGIHLQRTRLHDLADTLALAAADTLTTESVYTGTSTPDEFQLTGADVSAAVDDHLARYPGVLDGLRDVVVETADSPDGQHARVVLSATATPTLLSPVTQALAGGVRISVESTARAR